MPSDPGADSAVSCDMVSSRSRRICLPLLSPDELDMAPDEMGEMMWLCDPLACDEAQDAEGQASRKGVEEWGEGAGNTDG